jgi:HK97 family phage portal protein
VIVRTFDGLQSMTPTPTFGIPTGGSLGLYDHQHTYGEIFRTQPNVRICVEFLARNIAHVPMQAFRRVSDTDRVRLADHDIIRWLGKPNPATGRYRLIECLVGDLAIYYNAYWLKVRYRGADGRDAIGLVRLPPEEMTVAGGILPTHFVWTVNGRARDFDLSEIVHFGGYNPLSPLVGLSPLETLRRVLAEESAAGQSREAYWRNASRHEGIIERPIAAPKWTATQKQTWREQYQAKFAGASNSGLVPVLEDGMTFRPTSFSAKDSEFIQGGKLRREVCAAAFQIAQPFVGILDHATFSNIREQHKHLYQDTLGPWFEAIRQEVMRQVLIECSDQADVYLEFNIDAKMAGSFEEQAASLSTAVGRPFMKVNEARAIRNLPRDDDPSSDAIAAQQGGPAGTAPTSAEAATPMQTRSADPADDTADATVVDTASVILATQQRQRARLDKVARTDQRGVFHAGLDRWNRELTADLAALVDADVAASLAIDANLAMLESLGKDRAA